MDLRGQLGPETRAILEHGRSIARVLRPGNQPAKRNAKTVGAMNSLFVRTPAVLAFQ